MRSTNRELWTSGKSSVLEQIVIHLKSEIEKNLKFTIEQNIVEINRLKALVDEANNKQKQEQFVCHPAGSFGILHHLCSLQ